MAFHVGKDKGFIHIPKTGGRCVEDALRYYDFKLRKISRMHAAAPNDGKTYFVCVRRPDKWIVSYHWQIIKKGNHFRNYWKPLSEIDELYCKSIDLFVERIIKRKGIIGRMFSRYIDSCDCYIGHTESLDKDFSDFFGTKLTKLKNNYKSNSVFPEKYREALFESESEFIGRYYDSYDF